VGLFAPYPRYKEGRATSQRGITILWKEAEGDFLSLGEGGLELQEKIHGQEVVLLVQIELIDPEKRR